MPALEIALVGPITNSLTMILGLLTGVALGEPAPSIRTTPPLAFA